MKVVQRSWGYYRNIHSGDGFVVKELVIAPHSSLSMQRHTYRSETWNLVRGEAYILSNSVTAINPFEGVFVNKLHRDIPLNIQAGTWHQGCNDSDEPAHIVEIWKGPTDKLTEEDIERYDNELR